MSVNDFLTESGPDQKVGQILFRRRVNDGSQPFSDDVLKMKMLFHDGIRFVSEFTRG